MKTTHKFLALAFMAVAMVLASCSKDDDVNNVLALLQHSHGRK